MAKRPSPSPLVRTSIATTSATILWARIIEIASGREFTHNETRGQREIASWKYGVTL